MAQRRKKQLVDGLEADLRVAFPEMSDQELQEFSKSLEGVIDETLRRHRNARRLAAIDVRKDQQPASAVLTHDQVKNLPGWVREGIDEATVVGKSGKVIRLSDGRKYHLDNALNELSGAEWTFFLNSVLNTRFPTSGPEAYAHEIRKVHPSPKPPQLMRDLVKFFTRRDDWVLDYFAGVGGTLLGASLAGRNAVGVDLNPDYADIYRAAAASLGLHEQAFIVGEARDVLREQSSLVNITGGQLFKLVLIDPPYGDMMSREKTGESAKRRSNAAATPFTDAEQDLGNMTDAQFLGALRETITLTLPLLVDRGHLVLFIKDKQPEEEHTNLLHAELANTIGSIDGLRFLGLKIWADQGVSLYPYGYPHAFVANQIHQYILVFRVER